MYFPCKVRADRNRRSQINDVLKEAFKEEDAGVREAINITDARGW